ncbi:MAG: ATP-binding cassette domain-containing protein [Planctomycetota bacterium]|nr:MAG: ATP-binding cassette domain-containing protein [Planctomycetota bacterium]
MIVVKDVSKWYGSTRALGGVSFRIMRGEIVGFLGPNGAGKSTMMRILTTYLRPDVGEVRVCDLDVEESPLEVRRRVGYLPEMNPLYEEMRVDSFLRFIGRARGLRGSFLRTRLEEVVEGCGLGEKFRKPIYTLSKGFRQRVGLAQAMIHQPDVLILDEPTSGLDPNQILEIRRLIRQMGEERTVLLSTHILQEVQAVCDRVLIIHRGEIVADDLLVRLQEREESRFTLVVRGQRQEVERVFGSFSPQVEASSEGEGVWRVELVGGIDGEGVFDLLQGSSLKVREFRRDRRTLEDIFRDLTRD